MPWMLYVFLLESTELNNIKCLEHKKSSVTRSHWCSDFFIFIFCTHWYNLVIAHSSPSFFHLAFSAKFFGVFTSCFLQITYPAPVWLPLPPGTVLTEVPGPQNCQIQSLSQLTPWWHLALWAPLLPGLPYSSGFQDTAWTCFSPDLSAFFSLRNIGGCSVSAHCLNVGESSLSVFILTMWAQMSSPGFLHKWTGDGCIPPLRIRLANPYQHSINISRSYYCFCFAINFCWLWWVSQFSTYLPSLSVAQTLLWPSASVSNSEALSLLECSPDISDSKPA